MSQDTAQDPRSIAEEVIKELEQTQLEAEKAEPAKEPEKAPEPEKSEVKSEPKAEPDGAKAEVKTERPERKPQFIPVAKANAWRHEANEYKSKAAELEAKLAEANKAIEQAKVVDLDARAKEIAGEDASPEVVRRILEAAKEFAPKQEPNEDMSSLLELKKQLEQQKEEQSFQQDLNQTLAKFPELKGHESELKELAYAEGNEKTPLKFLAYQLREDLNLSPAPPSAEGKSASPAVATEIDFENLSEEEVKNLSDEDTDKLIKWQQAGLKKRTGIHT